MAEIVKRIGPASYWCRRCAHCNSVELDYRGDAPIYTCGDPYDGVEKKIPGDENISCTMFELANEVPVYELKKVKPIEEELKELKEKYSKHETWIDELIKASKRKDELIQDYREKLKKANDEINLLNSKFDKLGEYYRTDEKLIDNIQKVIFPQEEGSDYTYSYDEILNKIKDLKVQSDENGTMYEEIKELRAKNQAYLNEISDRLAKHTDQCDEITKLKNENISLNTINKGLAEDRKKLINYMRSLKIASENYLKEFTYGEDETNA